MATAPGYSLVADEQLDALLASGDAGLHDDLVTVCESILDDPSRARVTSAAVTTASGIVFRFAVPGRSPYKVVWSTDGPTILAVFPYPTSRDPRDAVSARR